MNAILRLENIPPEQMPEVVRIASELYTQDQEQEAEAQERQATVDAAAEIGLPEAYLHRAATEFHTRRIEQAQQRRRRNGLLAVVGAALMIGAGATIMSLLPRSTPTTPIVKGAPLAVAPAFGAGAWQLNTNPGTQAKVEFADGTAVLRVQRFAPDANNHFTANLDTFDGAKNLSGFRTVSFHLHGTLPHARLYLENGDERWRSPLLTATGQDALIRVDLSQFEHQIRTGVDARWQKIDSKAPATVENLSFKAGWYVNEIQAAGDLTLSDVRFE